MITIQPNLFLIGGKRCGSTALHLLLDQHDDINMSLKKEPYYFNAELKRQELSYHYSVELEKDLDSFVGKGKYRTVDKYNELFDNSRNYKYRGESSHYIYSPKTAMIIKKVSPRSKIIISVRNPIDRLYSEFCLYERRKEPISHNFDSYVVKILREYKENKEHKEDKFNLLLKGLYFDSLSHWIDIFGEDNVKIIVYEEFKNDEQKVLSGVYDWLNLPDSIIRNVKPQKTGKIRFKKLFYIMNSSGFIKKILKYSFSKNMRLKIRSIFYDLFIKNKEENSEISKRTRKLLVEFYDEDKVKLEKLLKKRIFWG